MKFIQNVGLLLVVQCLLSFVNTKGSCHLKADIVIVVDESGSVGNSNFELTKTATAKMVGDLKAGGSDLRVGIAKFATTAEINTPITSNLTKVAEDAKVMTYAGQATNTRAGYQKAREMLNAASRGSDYEKIIVFMTDGVTSAGVPPDDKFSLKFFKDNILVINVGIADYSRSELLTMARDAENIIEVASFQRMEAITEQVFEKTCEAEVKHCSGHAEADSLNSHFSCDSGFCDWKFSLKSDTCVKVYGSSETAKPNENNREWFKEGKKIEFTYGYSDCNNKKPVHVSIIPCEEDGSYNSTYEITEIKCGIEDLDFEIDFQEVFLKDKEEVVFSKGTFSKKPQCQANHGHKVLYSISKDNKEGKVLPDSGEYAVCTGDECKFNVDTTGNHVNQEKTAYIWAWFDGKYHKLEHGKNVGPFTIYFCSPTGIVVPQEIRSMSEYDLTGTNRITFPKWRFLQDSCQKMHGHKLKYQLSSSPDKYVDVPWAARFANCDNGPNCTISISNKTAFNMVNPYKHVYIWAQFDGKLVKEMGRVSNPIELYSCYIAQTNSSIDFESVYLMPNKMHVAFEKWTFNTSRCQAKHGHLLKYAISANDTYRSPIPQIDNYASCPNNTCYFNILDQGFKGRQAYIWAYFDGQVTLDQGKCSDVFDIMRCNDKNSFDEKFAHTKEVSVPIDEQEAITLKVAPSYVLDTIESISLKSFKKVVGYDTFESIRTTKRTAKKDLSDYYNITVSVMARRKSMDQCGPAAANASSSTGLSGHGGAIGGILDKGFPYDDAQRDEAFAPSMFPGFYQSHIMIGNQDIHVDDHNLTHVDSQMVKKSAGKTLKTKK